MHPRLFSTVFVGLLFTRSTFLTNLCMSPSFFDGTSEFSQKNYEFSPTTVKLTGHSHLMKSKSREMT